MPSQLDLDQGGTFREWVRAYLGPSIGWVQAPGRNVVPVTAAGTTVILIGASLVTVSFNGAGVIIQLPSTVNPPVGAGALPGPFIQNPITIVDIGGFAAANPITITPNDSETIMNLANIQITTNFGGFTLAPNSMARTWNMTGI